MKIEFQVAIFNTNNLHAVKWFQIFISNINIGLVYLLYGILNFVGYLM